MKKIHLGMISLLLSVSVTSAIPIVDIKAPTNLTATEVTNNSINFTWDDNSIGEAMYVVCIKTKTGYESCSQLPANTENYTKTGLTPYVTKKYAVRVANSNASDVEESTIYVKTTHTWDGELQKCINEDLGYGSDNTTHTPTKVELEGFTGSFYCTSKELVSMDPVIDIKNITKLNLYGNNIIGNIPTWIGQLIDLTYLNLAYNHITGDIPTEIGQLTKLIFLHLGFNYIESQIPVAIGKLTKLTVLDLGFNRIIGPIPAEIGQLTALEVLSLFRNKITGSIPPEIEQLTLLKYLLLYGNELSGKIPTKLGALKKLVRLQLCENPLTGSIPTELGALKELEWLHLQESKLTGSIPTEIGLLTTLTKLNFSQNNLSGEIPVSIKNLINIETDSLELHDNCNLYSDNLDVQSYIDAHQPEDTSSSGYQRILNTNSDDCSDALTLVPVIMYLLD